MYMVPKPLYDNFISRSGENHTRYVRQINNLDVNDGGRVMIKNDNNTRKPYEYKVPVAVNPVVDQTEEPPPIETEMGNEVDNGTERAEMENEVGSAQNLADEESNFRQSLHDIPQYQQSIPSGSNVTSDDGHQYIPSGSNATSDDGHPQYQQSIPDGSDATSDDGHTHTPPDNDSQTQPQPGIQNNSAINIDPASVSQNPEHDPSSSTLRSPFARRSNMASVRRSNVQNTISRRLADTMMAGPRITDADDSEMTDVLQSPQWSHYNVRSSNSDIFSTPLGKLLEQTFILPASRKKQTAFNARRPLSLKFDREHAIKPYGRNRPNIAPTAQFPPINQDQTSTMEAPLNSSTGSTPMQQQPNLIQPNTTPMRKINAVQAQNVDYRMKNAPINVTYVGDKVAGVIRDKTKNRGAKTPDMKQPRQINVVQAQNSDYKMKNAPIKVTYVGDNVVSAIPDKIKNRGAKRTYMKQPREVVKPPKRIAKS